MKRKKLFIGILAAITLVLVLLYYTSFQEYLSIFLEEQIGVWGYTGVFIAVFLLELLPQPVLSALLPFTAGILFDLNFRYLILIMIFGGITANYIAYALGRCYGGVIVGVFIKKKSYEKGITWFDKYGKKSITLLALTPLPYFPVLGGIFRMSLHDFTFYAILPRFFHFLIFCTLIAFFF